MNRMKEKVKKINMHKHISMYLLLISSLFDWVYTSVHLFFILSFVNEDRKSKLSHTHLSGEFLTAPKFNCVRFSKIFHLSFFN